MKNEKEEKLIIDTFFKVLYEKRKAYLDNYSFFAPKLSPRFNCFNYISPNEIKLSEIIAVLLSPLGDHDQGDIFLKLFLEKLNLNPLTWSRLRVICESLTNTITNNQRRIDIEINFNDIFGIAIENKPWASDRDQQLSDYAKHMQRKYKDQWCLIYLSGDDSEPDDKSISKENLEDLLQNNKFKKIDYRFIVEWLNKCEQQSRSDHVRHFLRDFIAYCKNEFLGEVDMAYANIIKEYAKEKDYLDLILNISKEVDVIRDDLIKKLIYDLNYKLKSLCPDWTVEYQSNIRNIYIKKYNWKNFCIAIEFGARHNYCDIGIRRIGYKPLNDECFSIKNSLKNSSYRSNPRWPIWYRFPSPYDNWLKSDIPWLNILSGETSDLIFEHVINLFNTIDNKTLLLF